MKAILFLVTLVRVVLGGVFLLLAGILALLADGLGRCGWLVAGPAAAESQESRGADLDHKLRTHLLSA